MSTARGRRPGGPDTRGEILDAARTSFAEKGFGRTTIRAVAATAGVDPALVHHYFGSKDDLFLAALQIPADPREMVPEIFADGVDGAGERLVRLVLSIWDDPAIRAPLVALVRTSISREGPESLLEAGILRMVLTPLRSVLPGREGARRSQLVATQMLGLIIGRYVLGFEPLASMPVEELVGWVGPTVQRYLDGPLPEG
ncbi:MAG TPA: TetR family transcriptional regulator [Nocardioidaceae bacterium]|nr:TetR family transcriptional regulator [Nocardioidaceae bacterium]